jgi:hypothetical protein
MNIGGEPHRLSYINSDEASLLKQLGGSGQPVRGVPAYYMSAEDAESDDPDPGIGWGWDTGPGGMAAAEADAAQKASSKAAVEEAQKADEQDYEGAGYHGFQAHGGFTSHPDPGAPGWDEFGYEAPEEPGFFESLFENLGLTDLLGFFMQPQLTVAKIGGKGLVAAYKNIQKGIEHRADLVNFIADPNTTAAQKKSAQAELNALDKGSPADPDETPSEEAEKKIKKVLDIGEEKEAEEGRWDKYYREQEDSDPYEGFEDRLKEVYGPDWRDILKRGVG